VHFPKVLVPLAISIPLLKAGDPAGTAEIGNNLVSTGNRSNSITAPAASRVWKAAWMASLAFEGAGTAFDSYTSYHNGPYESSALLRGSDGQFGNKAIAIKAVTFVGFGAAEWLLVRKWPKTAKLFIPINAFLGATYIYDGVHNLQFLAATH
jgi:hypothetical protein